MAATSAPAIPRVIQIFVFEITQPALNFECSNTYFPTSLIGLTAFTKFLAISNDFVPFMPITTLSLTKRVPVTT